MTERIKKVRIINIGDPAGPESNSSDDAAVISDSIDSKVAQELKLAAEGAD